MYHCKLVLVIRIGNNHDNVSLHCRATCLPADYCNMKIQINVLVQYKMDTNKRVDLVQNGYYYHLIVMYLVLAIKQLKNDSLGIKQQSLTHSQRGWLTVCQIRQSLTFSTHVSTIYRWRLKDTLNSDDQQFHTCQQNKQSHLTSNH